LRLLGASTTVSGAVRVTASARGSFDFRPLALRSTQQELSSHAALCACVLNARTVRCARALDAAMIVTDLHLESARRLAVAKVQRYDAFMDEEGPRYVRLRVKVDGAETLPLNKHLGASLFVRICDAAEVPDQSSPSCIMPPVDPNRVVCSGGGPGLDAVEEVTVEGDTGEYNEVENRHIVHPAAQDFTTFDHAFKHGVSCQIRVEYFLVETDHMGTGFEYDLGYLQTTMQDVLTASGEHLAVDLISMDHECKVGTGAFQVEWTPTQELEISLEVRIRVDKKVGWPFSSSRVFYTVYRNEFDGQWKPLYRSEVRDKVTDHPDARGCMMYTIAEINQLVATIGNDAGVIRIEFFHFKTTGAAHKLLGIVTTSLLQLRQAASAADLNMRLSTFTNAELVGRAVLDRSRLTANRSFFSLRVDFGGPVKGNYLFLDFSLAYRKGFFRAQPGAGARSVFTSTRPYYEISRTNATENSRDEVIYRSQKGTKKSGSRFLKFPVAKINIAKLKGSAESQALCFSVHSGHAIRVAWVRTSLSQLMNLSPGNVLPVTLRTDNSQGYVILDRRELTNDAESENHSYLSLRCVLGEELCVSDGSDESVLCELPFDLPDVPRRSSSSFDDSPPESPDRK
jgi:hypothetical protein